MSVIVFGEEFIGSLYKTLEMEVYHDSMFNLVKIERCDPETLKVCYENNDIAYKRAHLDGFLTRLWIANQAAGIMQYPDHDREIRIFEPEKQLGRNLAEYELFDEVNSLLYNLYTNGGNCFAQTKDIEFLEHITKTIAYKHTDQKFREIKDGIQERKRKREEAA